MPLLLIVKDDSQMRKFLRASLSSHGYRLVEAVSGAEELSQAAAYNPDMILLDLGLPDLDGLEVTKRLREWATAPIIVLSARTDSSDKVHALDRGADDYVSKPFGVEELTARLRAAVRRATATAAGGQDEEPLRAGDLTIDLTAKMVCRDGQQVRLTPTEWSILELLARNHGKLVSRSQLLHHIWGPAERKETSYLRVYLAQLRRKLEDDPAHPRHLVTEAGLGYRFRT